MGRVVLGMEFRTSHMLGMFHSFQQILTPLEIIFFSLFGSHLVELRGLQDAGDWTGSAVSKATALPVVLGAPSTFFFKLR